MVREREIAFGDRDLIVPSADTRAVLKLLEDNPILILEGKMGEGKSTVVLPGVRSAMKEAGNRFAKIDGHFFRGSKGEEQVENALRGAEGPKGAPLVVYVDSADYLYRRRTN